MVSKTFMGKPCRHGHEGLRYSSNRGCVSCMKARAAAQDPTYKRAITSQWQKENPERRNARRNRWRENNLEKDRARLRAIKKANPGKVNADTARRRARKLNATLPGHDAELRKIYEECPPGMTVDHIVPLQGKNVCGLHVPWNLQYLTRSENSAKGNRYDC